MTSSAFDVKRLKDKYSPQDLKDLLSGINLKIDAHLPVLYKNIKSSLWNEVHEELEELNKVVQPIHAIKLTKASDALSRNVDIAIENMFFEVKEIKGTYRKLLLEVKELKLQISANSEVKADCGIVDSQTKEIDETGSYKAEVKQQNEFEDSQVLKIKTSIEGKSEQNQCCSKCQIF